jgi:hypothetical protein
VSEDFPLGASLTLRVGVLCEQKSRNALDWLAGRHYCPPALKRDNRVAGWHPREAGGHAALDCRARHLEVVREQGDTMGTKSALAATGTFLVGLALSGCESSRPYYEGPRSYMPPQMGSSFAQGQGQGGYYNPSGSYYGSSGSYYNQPRPLTATTTNTATSLSSAKPDSGPDHPATSTEVASSVQLASGLASTTNGSAPMLTITLPAVKLLVPVNGLYSMTPPASPPVAKAPQPELVQERSPTPTWPMESQPAAQPVPPTQASPLTNLHIPPTASAAPATAAYTPPALPLAALPAAQAPAMLPEPSLQYSTPAVSTSSPPLQSMAPVMPSPMPAPISMQTMPPILPKLSDDTSLNQRATTMAAPLPTPTWPRPSTTTDESLGADLSAPSAMPMRRGPVPSSGPALPNGQNPYFQ